MQDAKPKRWKIIRWGKRILKWLFYSVLAYVAIVLIGLVPVNNDFRQAEDGIKLYVVSNDVHADIIMPVRTGAIDWSEQFQNASVVGDVTDRTYVAIGWGDKGFFLETETWDDFKLSTAANALLLPSDSCVHAMFTWPGNIDAVSVTVTEDQYALLVDYILATLKRDDEGYAIQIPGHAYSSTDAFFESKGRYHLLNTCNSWVGRGLKAAGVRVPWFSPMPKTPMLYIEAE